MSLNVLWYILSNIFLSMRWIALFKASFYLSPQQPRLFFFFFIRQFFFLHKMYKSFHYNSRTIKMFGINIFSFNLITQFSFTFLFFFVLSYKFIKKLFFLSLKCLLKQFGHWFFSYKHHKNRLLWKWLLQVIKLW